MTTEINEYLTRKTTPPRCAVIRLMGTVSRQTERSVICPQTPRLDGQLALVTGGNAGIGFQTCRGLLQRGARVVMASRDPERTRAACETLRNEPGGEGLLEPLRLDLADLDSVRAAADAFAERLDDQKLDILIANAGIWPRRYARSPQGHEIAFAINVLGHHLFIRKMIAGERFANATRLIVLTGDIYLFASRCTADYSYRTDFGGMLAYCRSKLGNIWTATELHRRYPALRVWIVHPGVVSTALGNENRAATTGVGMGPMISSERGAQTSLVCATQPNLVPGGYYHNALGLMQLRASDSARDQNRAQELWDTCENLCKSWL